MCDKRRHVHHVRSIRIVTPSLEHSHCLSPSVSLSGLVEGGGGRRITSAGMRPLLALQHTATHCNTLQHTAAHCNTPQNTATHCNRLQHIYSIPCLPSATYCNTLQHTATHCNTRQHTATHCNTLQHTATHCNTLQHLSCFLWRLFHNTMPAPSTTTRRSNRSC